MNVPEPLPGEPTPYDRVIALLAKLDPPKSQKQLCRDAGLDPSTLAQVKRNDGKMAMDTAAKLATPLGCTAADILGEDLTRFAASMGLPTAALHGEAPALHPAAIYVPWHRLMASPMNPRRSFDDDALIDLAESIDQQGVLSNLLVREIADDAVRVVIEGESVPLLEIIAGERRYRAIGRLVRDGRFDPAAPKVPVRIIEASDSEALALALLENLQRRDVAPIEEAEAFERLQRFHPHLWSTEAIATRIGMSVRYVQLRLQLVNGLAEPVKEAMREGKLSLEAARQMLTVPVDQQPGLLADIGGADTAAIRERVRAERQPRGTPAEKEPSPSAKPEAPLRRDKPAEAPIERRAPGLGVGHPLPSDAARLRDLSAQIRRFRRDRNEGIDHRAEDYLLSLASRLQADPPEVIRG